MRNVLKLKWINYVILDVEWMILAHEERCYGNIYLFLLWFKWCSQNAFVSQFTCLQPVCKNTSTTYSRTALGNDDEQNFDEN